MEPDSPQHTLERPVTEIADTVEDLTAAWFTTALREGGSIPPETSVASASAVPIGTGQWGLVVQARLEYSGAEGPPSLIVKLPSQDPGSRGMGVAMGAYEGEVRFYQELAPRLGQSVPHMHWGDVEPKTGRFTLVLDDLSDRAVVGDMVAGGTPEQTRRAIGALVALQAPLWDLPSLRAFPWLAIERTQMLFSAVPGAVAPCLSRFGDRLAPEHVHLIERLAPKAAAVPGIVWKPPFVVGQSDYRLDNMLFGVTAEAPPVTIVDWHGARLAPPGLDPAVFFASCVERDVRRSVQDELLRSYHDGLLAAGVTGFSWEDCWESYRGGSLFPFLLAVMVSITLVQTERGDQMFAQILSGGADLVLDTRADVLLD